jgi:hypothetical protein
LRDAGAQRLHIRANQRTGTTSGFSSWFRARSRPAGGGNRRFDSMETTESRAETGRGTDREFSANFDRQASATNSVSFLGLSPTKANETVSFFVSFHRGATQSGILFLVSTARAIARRIHHCRPWLSDVIHHRGCSLSVPCTARLWRASVSSDRSAQRGCRFVSAAGKTDL